MRDDGLRPNEAITALVRTIERSNMMPEGLTVLGYRPDTQGGDANVKLPFISVQPVSRIRITNFNTDRVDYVTIEDSDGNERVVGRVFAAEYRLDLALNIWVAEGSSYDVRNIANNLWNVLYEYDSSGPAKSFYGEEGQELDGIWKFTIEEGEPHDDLTYTPSLRRWIQNVTVWGYNTFDTTEDYMTDVNYPSEMSGNEDGSISTE